VEKRGRKSRPKGVTSGIAFSFVTTQVAGQSSIERKVNSFVYSRYSIGIFLFCVSLHLRNGNNFCICEMERYQIRRIRLRQ